jgi:DNA mismatch repair protein MutS2
MEHAKKVLEFNKIIKILSDNAVSESAKNILLSLEPETDLRKINELLDETEDGCQVIKTRGNPPLNGIIDIKDYLKRAKMGSTLMPKMFLNIADTLYLVKRLKRYISSAKSVDEEKEKENTIINLISSLNRNDELDEKIKNAIISEDEISDNASPELRSIRRRILSEQDNIKTKLSNIIRSEKFKTYIQDDIVTMRDGRYVIPVKQEYKSEVKGMVHDISTSGATVFIEPVGVLDSNNKIKELKIKEGNEIERILMELTNDVEQFSDELSINYEFLVNIDTIIAKSKLSLSLNASRPGINKNGYTVLKKARHPLIAEEVVVPIDFHIGKEFRGLVVTGPNTGGKTVALKTIGLLTLMTQSGLHIPVNEGSHIGVFEKIFADIGDEQSIEQSLSTFSSHMRNIVKLIKDSDENSLVLLDELGSGTDPNEGSALAAAILETLYNKRATIVATTHFSNIKVFALQHEGIENACCEFDIHTLKPTYKLLIGIPGKSNALLISKKLGLSDEVLKLSKKYLESDSMEFEDVLHKIEEKRSESEQDRLSAKLQRIESEKIRNDAQKLKENIKEKKRDIIEKAREEAKRILYDARESSKNIIKEARKLKEFSDNKEFEKTVNQINKNTAGEINKLEVEAYKDSIKENKTEVYNYKLKPGDTVFVSTLNQNGTVLSVPDKNDDTQVQVGIMKVTVKRTVLKKIDEQKEKIQKIQKSLSGSIKEKKLTLELDLRGQNLDDSIELVDKYLDDASLSGLTEVSLIHGKGTGVLRAGIHKYLRKTRLVKSFRLGNFGEGEDGVTIVTLK